MSKRLATLSFVILLTLLSVSVAYVHSHAYKSSDIQQPNLLNSDFSPDNSPLHDDSKHKFLPAVLTLVLIVIQRFFSATFYVGILVHRLLLYTPVFYQSNYVKYLFDYKQ